MKYQYLIFVLFAFLASCDEPTVRKQNYEVQGIDVSHYQQEIDWPLVASQNMHFAFVKATEGLTHKDTLFCKNWEAIKAAGLKRGAYHFFRPTADPVAQAQNFIAQAELEHGDLPPVLDVEVMDGVDAETLQHGVASWLNLVENHFKVKPILYTNQKFFNRHLANHFEGYPVWIARYHRWFEPSLNPGHDWQFWQYGNRGLLNGIEGNVDFNVFRGSFSDLEAMCIVRPAPLLDPPPPTLEPAVAAAP